MNEIQKILATEKQINLLQNSFGYKREKIENLTIKEASKLISKEIAKEKRKRRSLYTGKRSRLRTHMKGQL